MSDCPQCAELEKQVERLQKTANAARELEDYLGKNSGDNADWPIHLVARDEESANHLTQLLQNLQDSLKP